MLVMNQIREQKSAVFLWLGCSDNSLNNNITEDPSVSRQYLKNDRCLRRFHDFHFKEAGIPCNEKMNDVTRNCSNFRKKSDSQWKYLIVPKGYDFDVKLWLLTTKSGCLCDSDICLNDDRFWHTSVKKKNSEWALSRVWGL